MSETNRRADKTTRTRRNLQEHAIRLFLRDGYEATTIDRIAAEAGVSHMTFYRYFPTKEDVVLDDDYDPMLESSIRNRPSDEPPIQRVHTAIRGALAEIYQADRHTLFVRTRLLLRTPALRARLRENQFATQRLLEQALDGSEPSLRTRVLAAACLGAMTTALQTWVDGDGSRELPDLIDEAFRILEGRSPHEGAPAGYGTEERS